MLTVILSVVLGYYALNFLVVVSRLAFHWSRARWSKNVWFDMELRGPEAEKDPYSYFTVIPWFYEEKGSHFSFSFNPLGFSAFFVPVKTIGKVLEDHLGGLIAWQVLYDSRRTSPPAVRASLSAAPSPGTGLSPGIDLLFFTGSDPGKDAIDRFGSEAGKSIVPGRLLGHLCEVFEPQFLLLKNGNRWIVGCKDPGFRAVLMTSLFAAVGGKLLAKSRVDGQIRGVPRDGADRFMARGQVRWWMKGRLENDAIVIEGDGLRPGEVTSADWALVTIPFDRS